MTDDQAMVLFQECAGDPKKFARAIVASIARSPAMTEQELTALSIAIGVLKREGILENAEVLKRLRTRLSIADAAANIAPGKVYILFSSRGNIEGVHRTHESAEAHRQQLANKSSLHIDEWDLED